jgi:hypothetical protein
MKLLSLEPFVPSGKDFEKYKALFIDLGFNISWEAGGYAGLEKDGCSFILQHFEEKAFAENFMLSVKVEDVAAFRNELIEKDILGTYGIKIGAVTQQPYGKEVNMIDIAGVCWHFVE